MFKKIEWPNFLFMTLSPLVTAGALVWLLMTHTVSIWTWGLMFTMLTLTGLSITAGYHRLYSHKTYEATFPVHLFCLLFGSAAFEGSVIEWASAHRDHHQFVDTEKDPYNIKEGFWHAHIGWIIFKFDQIPDYSNVKDLFKNPLVVFQHRHWMVMGTVVGLVVPTFLGFLWNDPWGGLIVGGLLRMVLNHHFTFLINSLCHTWGDQTYSDRHSAKDNWITALFTYGEGYHNFHHEFASDYRNGVRSYQFDPAKWLIRFFEIFGMASKLKTVSQKQILDARILMERKRFEQKLDTYPMAIRKTCHELMVSYQQHVQVAYQKWIHLKKESGQYKADKIEQFNQRARSLKIEMTQAKKELNEALKTWKSLINGEALPIA